MIAYGDRAASIILTRLPMPISENHAYLTRTGGEFEYRKNKAGREYRTVPTYRVPTKEHLAFKQAMQEWRLENLELANMARNRLVAPLTEYQQVIRVDRFFAFKRSRLFTLSGKPKKLDASNRVKIFDDALAEHVLGLDDAWFWKGLEEKVECGEDERECAIVVLTPTRPRTLAELMLAGESGKPRIIEQIRASEPPGAPVNPLQMTIRTPTL